jgi:hypothetical protein
MQMLTPSEAKFFFRAVCYSSDAPSEDAAFEYYLPSNDTTEVVEEIEEGGWIITHYSVVPTNGKAIQRTEDGRYISND